MTEAATKIPMLPVESSNIAAVGHDAERKLLAVRFRSGSIFHYANIEPELHERFLSAESLGQFFGTQIRGKFPGAKMTGDCPKCGAKNGWVGETCADCGCAEYVDTPKAVKP